MTEYNSEINTNFSHTSYQSISITTWSSSVWFSLKVSTLILFSVSDPDLLGENVRHLLDDQCFFPNTLQRGNCTCLEINSFCFPSHDRQTFKDPALLSDSSSSNFVKEHISSNYFFSLPIVLKTFVNLLACLK
jgi:hypothetical protein